MSEAQATPPVAAATTSQTELRLVNVARASLEELLLDYEDYLRQHGHRQWDKNDPEALAVRSIGRQLDQTDKSDPVAHWRAYARWLEHIDPAVVANAMLCLIHQTNYLLAGIIGAPPQPGLLGKVDKYELLRVLGQGGMGIVFLARDTETGFKAALKLPRQEFAGDSALVRRFLREARRLQELKHPHLVPVLAAREVKGGAYFVMPYFDQGSLAQRIKPGVPLPREEILQIVPPVAEALQAIHAGGFTHRDIKPGNILLGSNGEVCLADFGLARTVLNDPTIQPGKEQCEGTPVYMSPQMAAGQQEDTRCDIYAFGALLYEMLTAQPPYQGQSTREVRDRILAGPPRPITELNAGADIKLVQLAEWAMAREQRDRYANMGDLVEDLRRIVAGKELIGPHGLARQGPWSFVLKTRSRRLLAAAGAALVLVMVWALRPQQDHRERSRAAVPLPQSSIEPTNSPWQKSVVALKQVMLWNQAVPVDWDDLPGKDLLVQANNRLLTASSSEQILGFWPGPAPFHAELTGFLVTEGQGDGKNGVLVSWNAG